MIKSKKTPKSTRASSKNKEDDFKDELNSSTNKPIFLITIIVIIVIVALVLLAKNFLGKNGEQEQIQEQTVQQNQEQEAKNDLDNLIARVSQLIEINQNEVPTIATVQDPEVLKSTQPVFYKDAEKGDRLLVWSDKAVLYSVTKDKLISVMLIDQQQLPSGENVNSAESNTATTTATTVEEENPVINVLNGTRTAGLAGRMKTKLVGLELPVASIGDAGVKTYTDTVIVKLTDEEMPATLKALKDATGAEVVTSLENETALKGDFTIIVGEDFE
ncbi:MAG: LytR C-terminal domain-containing protein [Patescibacteria group bacterium]|nr:LytR C-terminal domain-containing protein [Patescibacteria group bacterium]